MPPDRTPRRQEPVSCASCRKKKLRCDRSHPCTNCRSRAIQCEYEGRRAEPGAAPTVDVQDLQAENIAIKARLRRLEDAVLGGDTSTTSPATTTSSDQNPAPQRSNAAAAAPGLRSPLPTTQASSPELEPVRGYTDDSRWLEGVAAKGSSYLSLVLSDLRVEVQDLPTIAASISSGARPTQILLPSWEQTMQLFHAYEEHVDTLQHVLYLPTVRSHFEALYASLRKSEKVVLSHLALLLAITASISGYWALGGAEDSIYRSTSEAHSITTYWISCALDTLDHALRTVPPDLEIVQARIMILFLVYHLEGFSPMLRHLHAGALANAKDVGLHMTDAPHSAVREETQAQIIDAEVRRRVWWHLASTDWGIAIVGGPHDGAYSVHPTHMQVKKPRNINDSDLATQPSSFSRPPAETTETSYYLLRIRLGEACRDVADILWELHTVRDPAQIPYPSILALDAKFAALSDDLPNILRLENSNNDTPQQQDASSFQSSAAPPQLIKQCYFTYLTAQARRCKLHLPFLLRAQRDPRYQTSRTICLDSARGILRLKDVLPYERRLSPWSTGGNVKVLGILHHFFYGIAVLVMDLCVNRAAGRSGERDREADSQEEEEERKREVREACGILESARSESRAAGLFLESLRAVLRKHRVWLGDEVAGAGAESGGQGVNGGQDGNGSGGVSTHADGGGLGQESTPLPTMDADADIDFDTLWQSYFDLGANEPGSQGWDALFGDLDMGLT